MERARSSTSDSAGAGDTALLVRSYSAGSSGDGGGVSNQQEEQGEERHRRQKSWEQRVVRLRRKAEEQRARFYIVRRCLHMLLCWRDDTKR